jgi:transmembrane sensor
MGRHITEHGGSLRKSPSKHSVMEKSNFDQLLQRYLTGQVTEQERTKIEAWLDVMKTEDNSDLELSKEEEDRLFQKITSESSNVDEVISLVPPKRSNWNYWLKIAAAILLLAIASFTITRIINNEDIPLFATNTKVEKLILNDGSLVWLRGKSSLQYYHKNENSTTVRFAELRGEGLFEVAKDPQRPFIPEGLISRHSRVVQLTCCQMRRQSIGVREVLRR